VESVLNSVVPELSDARPEHFVGGTGTGDEQAKSGPPKKNFKVTDSRWRRIGLAFPPPAMAL
jgi:hypothetical protein